MAQGTGLPIPRSGEVSTQTTEVVRPNVVDFDRAGLARMWGEVAQVGQRVQDAGFDYLARAEHQRQVGYLAEQENEIEGKRIELEGQHRFDPKGFEDAWRGYTTGKMEQAQGWAIPHLTKALGTRGNASLRAIQTQTLARDERLDAEAVGTNITAAGNDLVATGMNGTLHGDAGRIAAQEFGAKLQAAVNAKLMSPEKADFLQDEKSSEAFGALAARQGVEQYKRTGSFKAGEDYLTKNILENESLKLSPAARRRAFSTGMEALRRERQVDATERAGIVQEANDLTARIKSGQDYDLAEVRDADANLARVGAVRARGNLLVEHGVRQATQGLGVRDLSRVAVQNRAATAERARTARDFFVSRGWTPAQAAGIVGNLVQESGLDPTTIHDEGTGLGIAGWRLERRTALQQFAASRGKSATDFQTQLEFLDQEIKTSPREARALAELRAARTPQEAARAFIHFERPAGYTPDRPEAGHGFINRVANAQAAAGEAIDTSAFSGEITKRIQGVAIAAGKKTWTELKPQIDAGRPIEAGDLEAIQTAAVLSGDQNWIREVDDYSAAQLIGSRIRDIPATERQAVQDQIRQNFNARVADSVEKQTARQTKQITDAPVDFAVNERKIPAPAPLDFSSAAAIKVGIDQRVAAARGVANEQQIAVGSPLRESDRATIAGAIATGEPERAAVAMNGLVGLPDDMLLPALRGGDIRGAVTGASRSDNVARYNAAMTFLDQLDARAPEVTRELFKDAAEDLKWWQKHGRFLSPEQLTLERRKANDPGVREQLEKARKDGEAKAGEYSTADVVEQFNKGWWQYLGFGRAQAPTSDDAWTNAALMSDFQAQFGRLSAKGLPNDKALEGTMELLKTQWAASPVNAGRLMRNGPEKFYPMVGGTWDWMTKQVEDEVGARLGTPRFGGDVMSPTTNWDYTIVADRQTQTEAQRFREFGPQAVRYPSYKVMVVDRQTGQASVLQQRFTWNPGPDVAASRENFEAERARVSAAQANLADTLLGAGPEFPDVAIPPQREPTKADLMADLDRRQDALNKSGLGGEFYKAQSRRIEAERKRISEMP